MLNTLNDMYDSGILNIVASIMPESVIFVPRDYYNVKELQDFKVFVDQKFANSKIEIEAKLDEKIDKSALGISVATLVGGKIPSDQLPSFVDDVLEYDTFDDLPEVGERGIIYVTLDNNSTYRWSGSTYIPLANLSGYYTKAETESLISEAVAKVHLSFTANYDDVSLTLDKLKAITIAFKSENAVAYIKHNQITYAIESIKQNVFTYATTITASAHLYDDTTNEYSIKLLRYIFDTDDADDTIKVIPSVETNIIPTRDSNGNITTNTPVQSDDCAPKSYVDSLTQKLAGKTIHYIDKPWSYDSNGTPHNSMKLSISWIVPVTGLNDYNGDFGLTNDGVLFTFYDNKNVGDIEGYWYGKLKLVLKGAKGKDGKDGTILQYIKELKDTNGVPYVNINLNVPGESTKTFLPNAFLMGLTHYADGFIQKDGHNLIFPQLTKDETLVTEAQLEEKVGMQFHYSSYTGKAPVYNQSFYVVFGKNLTLHKKDGTVVASGAKQMFFMTAPYGEFVGGTLFVAMGAYVTQGSFSITNLKIPVEGLQAELDDGAYITEADTTDTFFVMRQTKGIKSNDYQ